jgi:hypothetical protein
MQTNRIPVLYLVGVRAWWSQYITFYIILHTGNKGPSEEASHINPRFLSFEEKFHAGRILYFPLIINSMRKVMVDSRDI